MIQEISTWIFDQLIPDYWEMDVNWFTGQLPIVNLNQDKVEAIPRVLVIAENTSAGVIGQLPDRADKPIQIWNRHKSYPHAREDAYVFFDILHGATQWELPIIVSGKEYRAMIIDAMGQPYPIENPDEKKRVVFSTNYMFRIKDANL